MNGIAEKGVKSIEISRKANCEGDFPRCSVIEARRSGYQTGLDTPVVQTDNDEYFIRLKLNVCQLTREIFYLETTIARLKLKEIGGDSLQAVEHCCLMRRYTQILTKPRIKHNKNYKILYFKLINEFKTNYLPFFIIVFYKIAWLPQACAVKLSFRIEI